MYTNPFDTVECIEIMDMNIFEYEKNKTLERMEILDSNVVIER